MERDLQRDELIELLSVEEKVWIREGWSIESPDDRLLVRFVEVSLRIAPPTWDEHDWQYRQARLRSAALSGDQLAEWIERLKTDPPNDLAWPARYTRLRSGMPGQSETLYWPVDEWRSPFTAGQRNAVVGELVPGDGPLFRSFDLGVANHLGLVYRPGWSLPSPEFVVRRQDRQARIRSAFVARAAISAEVEGDDIVGATLEVAGETPGESLILDASSILRPVTFDHNLPQQPWLALHRDGTVLDARLRLERPPPGVSGEWGVTWEAAPAPADNSPFSDEEQAQIHAAILAVKLKVSTELPPGPATDHLQDILDDADETRSTRGRADWRKYVYGDLVDAVVRQVVTLDHVRLVYGLLRVTVAQVTGLDLPALPT